MQNCATVATSVTALAEGKLIYWVQSCADLTAADWALAELLWKQPDFEMPDGLQGKVCTKITTDQLFLCVSALTLTRAAARAPQALVTFDGAPTSI